MTNNQDNIPAETTDDRGERIAKALARAGVGSRRDIERMIEAGRISMHGRVLETPAVLVKSLDGITVDGQPVETGAETRLWRFHKRKGTLTTHRDPEGRPTVFDHLPEHMGRVVSVGRLDMPTEGLLLLTNDGELARWLELPKNGYVRRYRVRVHGFVNENRLDELKDGVTIDGVHYGEIEAELERTQGTNSWLNVAIREGKNREVRRVMDYLGLTVNRLIRTHYGPFGLGTLQRTASAEVSKKQLYELLGDYFKETGKSVAAEATDINPKKWAKAKPKTKVKLGGKRRRSFDNDDDKPRKKTGPVRGQGSSKHQAADDKKSSSGFKKASPHKHRSTGTDTGHKPSGGRGGQNERPNRNGSRPNNNRGPRGRS